MHNSIIDPTKLKSWTTYLGVLVVGAIVGGAITSGQAQMQPPPTEHKGLKVLSLGVLPEESLKKQIGLSGYVMQLREITIEPGGAIAKHSHKTRPGLVRTIKGTWTEGRASGERDYAAGQPEALLEDENTEHWFWNKGKEPATALVCDIVPAK